MGVSELIPALDGRQNIRACPPLRLEYIAKIIGSETKPDITIARPK
jgi:hypothetical protein